MKNVLIAFPLLFIVFTACEQEQLVQEENLVPDDWSFIAEGVMKPIVLSRECLDMDSLLDEIVKELHEIDYSEYETGARYNDELGFYNGVDILISEEEVTLTPIEGENPPITADDNEDCGGKAGDCWKSCGTSSSESGTKALAEQASDDLKPKLSGGKCMDIRIKRNTFSAPVCSRVISC